MVRLYVNRGNIARIKRSYRKHVDKKGENDPIQQAPEKEDAQERILARRPLATTVAPGK